MTRLRPFFKHYGSKHRLAPRYPAPRHDVIIEPFAGSAQYATLYADRYVVLCEADEEIAALWQWLTTADPDEVRSLPVALTPGEDIRALPISRGGRLLIRAWQRVGRGNCWTVSKWNGVNSGLWCAATRDAIARQVPRIRHWIVEHGSYELLPDVEATWFIDPPYQSQPCVYGSPPIDYPHLAQWCRTRPGQTIVCEGPGADWLPFSRLAENTVGRTRQGGTRARREEWCWHASDGV